MPESQMSAWTLFSFHLVGIIGLGWCFIYVALWFLRHVNTIAAERWNMMSKLTPLVLVAEGFYAYYLRVWALAPFVLLSLGVGLVWLALRFGGPIGYRLFRPGLRNRAEVGW